MHGLEINLFAQAWKDSERNRTKSTGILGESVSGDYLAVCGRFVPTIYLFVPTIYLSSDNKPALGL